MNPDSRTVDGRPTLTVVIPAYNAEPYLQRALDSIPMSDLIEVIIVDDGSTDATGDVADAYAERRPRVHAVHQSNAGHGGAINTGISRATGRYLKVLDADDWLDPVATQAVLATLEGLERGGGVDLLVTNYVHERLGKAPRHSRYASVFPENRTFAWSEVGRFNTRQHLMMHALTYRTDVLRLSEFQLPENSFYVDNLFVVVPLLQVRTMYYLPVDFYRYFIGSPDQSVNPETMVRRVDQQLMVNRLALRALPPAERVAAGEFPLEMQRTLLHHVEAVSAVTSATLARGGTAAHLATRAMFWSEIRAENPWLYARLRRTFIGASANLPGVTGRRLTALAYHVARRVVGFS